MSVSNKLSVFISSSFCEVFVSWVSVKSRFTLEELDLMRKLSGEANNLNQLAKRANQTGVTKVGNEILVVLEWIKALFDDR